MVLVVAIIIFAIVYRKKEQVRWYIDSALVRILLIGAIVRGYNVANFCRTLGMLLRSGVTICEALQISGDTISNEAYKKEIKAAETTIQRGERMSAHLAKFPTLFPDILVHMISVGESTGNLPETLLYLSEYYEEEVDNSTKDLSNSIEPALMIAMGLLVGLIAVSVITPIYSVTQNLHH